MLDGSRTTLWELFERRVAEQPDRTFLVDVTGTTTYAEVHARAERLAAGFLAEGMEPGSAVSWQLPTRAATLEVQLALTRLGVVQNPMVTPYREREVSSALDQLGSRFLLVPRSWRSFDHAAMAHALAADRPGVRVMVVDDGLPEGDPADLPPPPGDRDAVRHVYTTSGTTSAPKCVQHTDASLISVGTALIDNMAAQPTDVGCIPFPIAHAGGASFLVCSLSVGFPFVLIDPFVPDEAAVEMERHGVTILGGAFPHYIALLNEQRRQPDVPLLPSLRLFTGGGAPKRPEQYHQILAEMGVRTVYAYGMTECPTITMCLPSDTDEQLAHTEGVVAPGVELRVVGPDGPLPPDTEGDIEIRGRSVTVGYLDAELTESSLTADGWFKTGDRGRMRSDDRLVLTGRTKDLIIRKGENISALEVELVLGELAGVAGVAVIGLPDVERGERVCAVLELVPGATAPTLADVDALCSAKGMMRQKVPEQLEVVDALPRNASTKVLKQELKARFAPQEAAR